MAATIGSVVAVNERTSAGSGSLGGLGFVNTGSSRLVMLITYFNGAGQHTDATVNGQSGTYGWRFSNGTYEVQMWYWLEADLPTGGAEYDVYSDPSVSVLGSQILVNIDNVDQTTPFSAVTQDNDGNLTFVGTGTSGNLIFDMACQEDGWNSSLSESGDATTTHYNIDVGGTTTASVGMYLGSGASSASYNAAITQNSNVAFGAFEVYETPPSAGGGSESETDGFTLGDSATGIIAHSRSATDGFDVGDSVAHAVAYVASGTDGFTIGDSAVAGGGPPSCSAATGSIAQSNEGAAASSPLSFNGTYDRIGAFWSTSPSVHPLAVDGMCFKLRKVGSPTGSIWLVADNTNDATADPPADEGTQYDVEGIATDAGGTEYFFTLGSTLDVDSSNELFVGLEVSGSFDGSNYIEVIMGPNATSGRNTYAVTLPSTESSISSDPWFKLYGSVGATDGFAVGDTVAQTLAFARSATDGFTVGDVVQGGRSYSGSATDGIELSESIDTTHTTDSGPDGIDLGDSVSFVTSAPASVIDALEFGDDVVYGLTRTPTDGIDFGDSATGELTASVRSITDGFVFADIVDTAGASSRTPIDKLLFGDSVARVPGYLGAGTDQVVFGDAVGYSFASVGSRSVADGFVFGDSVAYLGGFPRSIADMVFLGESVSALGSAQLSVVKRDMKPGTGEPNILGD